ncbi:MAG: hypothetical protein KC416_07685 [Myxococcales bacterium]|nr:hypothetical protein [Myxococcales bacterium]
MSCLGHNPFRPITATLFLLGIFGCSDPNSMNSDGGGDTDGGGMTCTGDDCPNKEPMDASMDARITDGGADSGTDGGSGEADGGHDDGGVDGGTDGGGMTSPCSPNPCLNGGACAIGVGNTASCTCAAGYTGSLCQTEIDECMTLTPCANGTCTDQVNGYLCACDPGYHGTDCDQGCSKAGTECSTVDTCAQGDGSPLSCTGCSTGYYGTACESACSTDGTNCTSVSACVQSSGAPSQCGGCVDGFYGKKCNAACPEAGNNCVTIDSCVQTGGAPTACTGCDAGFYGDACDTACSTEGTNCTAVSTCDQATGEATSCATCAPGYSGATCDVVGFTSCLDLFNNGVTDDGVYPIDPDGAGNGVEPFMVYCLQTEAGGGWTLLSNRRADTNSVETCGANLREFFTSGCGAPTAITAADSYSLTAAQRTALAFDDIAVVQYLNGVADVDDAYIVLGAPAEPFPDTNLSTNTAVDGACDINGANCDMTNVYWKYIGDYWYHSSKCLSGSSGSTSYRGNYGLCDDGASNMGDNPEYDSSRLFGNRAGYAETKLWGLPGTGQQYQERVFAR